MESTHAEATRTLQQVLQQIESISNQADQTSNLASLVGLWLDDFGNNHLVFPVAANSSCFVTTTRKSGRRDYSLIKQESRRILLGPDFVLDGEPNKHEVRWKSESVSNRLLSWKRFNATTEYNDCVKNYLQTASTFQTSGFKLVVEGSFQYASLPTSHIMNPEAASAVNFDQYQGDSVFASQLLDEASDDEFISFSPWPELDFRSWLESESVTSLKRSVPKTPKPSVKPLGTNKWTSDGRSSFLCHFEVGLEDDSQFCLVKRLLGKGGMNMKTIASECNVKVRLRGRGSGFREGPDSSESQQPLQLCLSTSCYNGYVEAFGRIIALLQDLYKHYKRFARSIGAHSPDLKPKFQEVRRWDLGIDLLTPSASHTILEGAHPSASQTILEEDGPLKMQQSDTPSTPTRSSGSPEEGCQKHSREFTQVRHSSTKEFKERRAVWKPKTPLPSDDIFGLANDVWTNEPQTPTKVVKPNEQPSPVDVTPRCSWDKLATQRTPKIAQQLTWVRK